MAGLLVADFWLELMVSVLWPELPRRWHLPKTTSKASRHSASPATAVRSRSADLHNGDVEVANTGPVRVSSQRRNAEAFGQDEAGPISQGEALPFRQRP